MNLEGIQTELQRIGLDGWLFFDHHLRDPLAYRVLGLPVAGHVSRRWYYFIPAHGEPRGLVHRVEPHQLDSLPGKKLLYARWQEQEPALRQLLDGAQTVAMQYSPHCAVPYVANVDAGTVELIRSLGTEVVSSAELIQTFEAKWTPAQLELHLEAGRRVDRIREEAFDFIGTATRNGNAIDEYAVQQFVMRRFAESEMVTNHPPIVGVGRSLDQSAFDQSIDQSGYIRGSSDEERAQLLEGDGAFLVQDAERIERGESQVVVGKEALTTAVQGVVEPDQSYRRLRYFRTKAGYDLGKLLEAVVIEFLAVVVRHCFTTLSLTT